MCAAFRTGLNMVVANPVQNKPFRLLDVNRVNRVNRVVSRMCARTQIASHKYHWFIGL